MLEIVINGVKLRADVSNAIIGGNVNRTMAGASTIELQVHDDSRDLLNSGFFGAPDNAKPEFTVLGKRFVLVQVRKDGPLLTLTAEDFWVNRLRANKRKRTAFRRSITRRAFQKMLVAEVPGLTFFAPEVAQGSPLSPDPKVSIRGGFPPDASITVQGAPATKLQMANTARVLAVGVKLKADQRALTSAVMTINQESRAMNLSGGDADSVGIFQQRPSQGWTGLRNIEKAALEYFAGKAHDINQPGGAIYFTTKYGLRNVPDNSLIQLWQICQYVQGSKNGRLYQAWADEAKHTIEMYDPKGATNNVGSIDTGQFSRGLPGQRESSWETLQRLADAVNYVVFVIGTTLYYVSQEWLYAAQPSATFEEGEAGVDEINFDFDEGKGVATADVTGRSGLWTGEVGETVRLTKVGPANGKWLITSIQHDILDETVTIGLQKPAPKLSEAKSTDLGTGSGGAGTSAVVSTNQPLAAEYHVGQLPYAPGGTHDPHDLHNWQSCNAVDLSVPFGTEVRAVTDGTIGTQIGFLPGSGDINGGKSMKGNDSRFNGRFGGMRVTLIGSSNEWYYAHLSEIDVKAGQKVSAGDKLGLSGMANGAQHLHFAQKLGDPGKTIGHPTPGYVDILHGAS